MGQTAQSLPCSIMEIPHAGLDECPRIILSCFRARNSTEVIVGGGILGFILGIAGAAAAAVVVWIGVWIVVWIAVKFAAL